MRKGSRDKADVVIKFIAGRLASPLIAWVVYAWNTKALQRNTATQRIGIAIAILAQRSQEWDARRVSSSRLKLRFRRLI